MCNSTFPEVYAGRKKCWRPSSEPCRVSSSCHPTAALPCFHSQGFSWYLLIYRPVPLLSFLGVRKFSSNLEELWCQESWRLSLLSVVLRRSWGGTGGNQRSFIFQAVLTPSPLHSTSESLCWWLLPLLLLFVCLWPLSQCVLSFHLSFLPVGVH